MKLNVTYTLKTKSGKQLTIDHEEALELFEQLVEKLGKTEYETDIIYVHNPPIRIEPTRQLDPLYSFPNIICSDHASSTCDTNANIKYT